MENVAASNLDDMGDNNVSRDEVIYIRDQQTCGDDINVSSDEVICNSNHQDVNSNMTPQEETVYILKEIKGLVNKKCFVIHIKPYICDMDQKEIELDRHMRDSIRRDCSVIFTGETSSGKSSIINGVLNKKILPCGARATTTRICRIKHSKELVISTRNANDTSDLTKMKFLNTNEMAEELKTLARTNDPRIGYIDVCMPVPFQQGNVVIVDTPGVGDIDQNEVVERMMDYLPNALAFVFVINVPAAGGLQRDRFTPILDHVRESLNEMVSFDPHDVIFLLNKWDALLEDDDKEEFFESTKTQLNTLWENVKPSRILQLSMNKNFQDHAAMFQCFQWHLKDVIQRNKDKRLIVHLGFSIAFLTVCENAVKPKLKDAETEANKSRKELNQDSIDIDDLEEVLQEESANPDEHVNRFIDKVTKEFHMHVNSQTFKSKILNNVGQSLRLTVGIDIDADIEDKTKTWQVENVQRIYQEIVIRRLNSKLSRISKELKGDLMKGFQTPFDIDQKFLKSALQGAVSIAGGVALRVLLFEPKIALTVAASGLLITSLANFGYMRDFETVRREALEVRIKNLTTKIRKTFENSYAPKIRNNMEDALNKLRTQLALLKEKENFLQRKHDDNTKKMEMFSAIDTQVSILKKRLEDLEQKIVNA